MEVGALPLQQPPIQLLEVGDLATFYTSSLPFFKQLAKQLNLPAPSEVALFSVNQLPLLNEKHAAYKIREKFINQIKGLPSHQKQGLKQYQTIFDNMGMNFNDLKQAILGPENFKEIMIEGCKSPVSSYGFCNLLFSLDRDNLPENSPNYMCLACDNKFVNTVIDKPADLLDLLDLVSGHPTRDLRHNLANRLFQKSSLKSFSSCLQILSKELNKTFAPASNNLYGPKVNLNFNKPGQDEQESSAIKTYKR